MKINHLLRHWAAVLIICFACFAAAEPAKAGSGPWVSTEAGRLRLLAAQIGSDTYAAVEFQLAEGWHTYWRFPGASGIAPQFQLQQPAGATLGAAIYPAPEFFDDGVGGFYGYTGSTGFILPITLPITPPNGAHSEKLSLRAQLGVCQTLCIPLDINLSMALDAAGLQQTADQQIIAHLMQQGPQPPSEDFFIARATYDGENLYLHVKAGDHGEPRVFVVSERHDVIGPPQLIDKQTGHYIFKLSAWSSLDHGLIGRKLSIVVRHQGRAIEQNIEVTKASN